MKTILVWVMCALVALASGCASVETAKSELGTGASKVYSSKFDPVWESTLKALPSLGLSIADEDKATGLVTGTRSMSLSGLTYGERIAIRVSREGEGQTRVDVISKRVYALNFTATDWEPVILERIGDGLPGASPNAFTALYGDAAQAYLDFGQRPFPRAFVIADGGRWAAVWGHRSHAQDVVAEDALERCRSAGHANCKLYAFNANVVWKP